MIGQQQLSLFDPSLDLRGYPIRVRAAYARLQAEVYRQRVELGRFKYGRLQGARNWSEPRYWREVDISKRSVGSLVRHGLLRWDGDDLLLVAYDSTADARADAFSELQRKRVMKRWHPAQGSDRSSDRSSDRILPPNPTESLKTGSTGAIPARARVVPFLLRESDPVGSPESIDLPPSTHPLSGEEGGRDRLSPGARRVWELYPIEKVDLQWLQPFDEAWHRLQLEQHADQVVEVLERFKRSAQWQNDRLINLPHNFLERKVKASLRRRWVEGCTCNYCRTNPPRAAKPERILNPPPLVTDEPREFRPWTPEQIAEAQALRESRGSA